MIRYAVRLARRIAPRSRIAPRFVRDWVSWGAGPRASQYLVLGAKSARRPPRDAPHRAWRTRRRSRPRCCGTGSSPTSTRKPTGFRDHRYHQQAPRGRTPSDRRRSAPEPARSLAQNGAAAPRPALRRRTRPARSPRAPRRRRIPHRAPQEPLSRVQRRVRRASPVHARRSAAALDWKVYAKIDRKLPQAVRGGDEPPRDAPDRHERVHELLLRTGSRSWTTRGSSRRRSPTSCSGSRTRWASSHSRAAEES